MRCHPGDENDIHDSESLFTPLPRQASPSGCKPFSSSGERARWPFPAVPIYFPKPRPSFVLDEGGCALDDANVSRFGRRLDEFTHRHPCSQHHPHPRTMQVARRSYGVTMQEPPGVSNSSVRGAPGRGWKPLSLLPPFPLSPP